MPSISCILPVYNGARFLRQAIESVLSQDPAPEQLIVVDDGSTDASGEIARSFGPPVTVLRQDNAGPAAARNRGLAIATGDFVCFQDADDIWVAGKLARQLACFAADPTLDLCYGHLQNFWEPELSEFAARVKDHMIAQPTPSHGPPLLLAQRSAFDRVGFFDESIRIGEDTDWHFRARETGLKWSLLPDVLLLRRRHGNNLTANWEQTRLQSLDLLRRSLARRRSAGTDQPPPAGEAQNRGDTE